MPIHPIAGFPLRISDQADIIEIYLDLIRQANLSAPGSPPDPRQPWQPHTDAGAGWFPDDRPDRD
jgi:hypothetical protein